MIRLSTTFALQTPRHLIQTEVTNPAQHTGKISLAAITIRDNSDQNVVQLARMSRTELKSLLESLAEIEAYMENIEHECQS